MNRLEPLRLPIQGNGSFFLVTLADITQKEVNEAKSYVDEVSLERASRFAFEKDQTKLIIVHAALRYLLGKLLQCHPTEVMILRNAFGKPYVQDHPLYFSLSYSDEYALIGIASDCPIGVDIEALNKERTLIDSPVLHSSEKEEIKNAEDPVDAFYDYWCAKEAVLKAIGIGFTEEKPPLLERVSNGVFKSIDPDATVYTHSIHGYKVGVCIL